MDAPFEIIKRQVWERDAYRCQECGLEVGRGRGLMPQTHHRIPRSQGGGDTLDNLITLCLLCHTTKLRHLFMLESMSVSRYPQFIKGFLWEVATNLLACADSYDPRRPPSSISVVAMLTSVQRALDGVKALAADCGRSGIGVGELDAPANFRDEQRQLESLIVGLRVAWQAHHTQQALDEIIRQGEQA